MKLIDRLKYLLGKIYVPIIWTMVIIILLALPGSMLPNEQGFQIPNFDKFVHICLFGGFVFLWCNYFSLKKIRSKKLFLIFFIFYISGNALGIGMEFVQRCCIPFRDFSQGDIIADMIGAGIAYGISNVWLGVENNSQ